MAKKKSTIEFGLHIGNIIYNDIKNRNGLLFSNISDQLDLTLNGFKNKLKYPHYGSTYDLIKVSLIMKKNYFDLINPIIKAKGLNLESIYTNHEVDQLKEKVKNLEKQNSRNEKIIEKFLDK